MVSARSAVAHGQAFVRTVKAPADTQITDIHDALFLLGGGPTQPNAGSAFYETINFVGAGSDADFTGGVVFPASPEIPMISRWQ